MYSKQIIKFSDFLSQPPKSYNEIARFLVMDCCHVDGALSSYIGELTESGVISPLGMFGWSHQERESFNEVPFNVKLPICDSIRAKEIIVVTNGLAFYEQYPLMLGINFTQPWMTSVSIPIHPIGGLTLTFATTMDFTESKRVFFTAIGSLLSLYASQLSKPPSPFPILGGKEVGDTDLVSDALTDRQSVIVELVEHGFSNAQIGSKLGYSESLIRQETVTIYRKLGVNGRKAMQKNSAVRLEQIARDKFFN